MPLDAWRHQLEVNLIGQVAVTQAVLGRLRASRGRVVFVSSLSGRVATAMSGPYSASKFALEARPTRCASRFARGAWASC